MSNCGPVGQIFLTNPHTINGLLFSLHIQFCNFIVKGTATLKSKMHAHIKFCNLPQTRSKLDNRYESYSNLNIKFLTFIKPMEAVILNI